MDLGGLEKDYREGGFVPLGAEERADDVPARLSKNEFVFTADAVRNAGQGDIDKGAEVMQNMMDNLKQVVLYQKSPRAWKILHKKCLIKHNNWRVE